LISIPESLAAALGGAFIDDVRLKYGMIHVSKFKTRLGKPLVEFLNDLRA
jgi:hypothetical protein